MDEDNTVFASELLEKVTAAAKQFTEFKVMQALLRHSSLRSTLDVYTQAVTPAKRAAQAAVVSLVFSSGANGAPFIAGQDTSR